MPDLRFDPLGRRRVLLAPERARRGAPPVQPYEPDPAPCDFCGGRESQTPPETFAIREPGTTPDTPGWSVRVVPNLYPATPVHEVVVHTPEHDTHFEAQDAPHRANVLRAYRARLQETQPTSAIIVWNRGHAAGASRTHPHGQIFGLDIVPPTLEREVAAFEENTSVLHGMAEPELEIVEVGGYAVFAHPAPFVADELLVVPPHSPRFEQLDDGELRAAADALQQAIARFCIAYGAGAPFNLVVHTAPRGIGAFGWHAHLMPRTTIWGGLEMGAEFPIVASDPYETARRLRAV